MKTLTISVANLQAGVATTKGLAHYLTTWWKYWLPHSDKPLKQAGEIMKHEGVDISFLIEVSGKSFHSGYRSQPDVVANAAGLENRQFFTTKKFTFFTHEGLSILSKYPLSNPQIHPLKKGILDWPMAECTVEIEGKKITLFLAHLALGPRVRKIQFQQIADILKNRQGPIILAGDFNEAHEDSFEMLLRETSLKYSCSEKSFPSWKPKHAFDRILFSGELKPTHQFIPEGPKLSDHLPLVVKSELI